MERLDRNLVEEQIAEMWDAIRNLPWSMPDYDAAVRETERVETRLRDKLALQDAMDKCAPEMFEIVREVADLPIDCLPVGAIEHVVTRARELANRVDNFGPPTGCARPPKTL